MQARHMKCFQDSTRKAILNDIFAPGWAVASLWQMLSPGRAADYFGKASETTKVLPPM